MSASPAIAVLCSGRGTNLQAILDAIRRRNLRARVSLVISDNPGAFALSRARAAGIPSVVVDPRRYKTREQYDRALVRIIDASGARLVVLAGFMRLLSPFFVRRYGGRVLNIHPALLPSFPGCRAVRDALRHGVRVTGVTVHFVDEQMDHGPILLQEAVRVKPGDTETALHERIHRVEHRLYPKAIQRVLNQRGRVDLVPKERH